MNSFMTRINDFRDTILRQKEQGAVVEDEAESIAEPDPEGQAELEEEHDHVLDPETIPDPEEVDFTDGRREYSGMPGNYQVVIRPVYNHVFLSRKYGRHGEPSIKMSWRFNEYGRIDLVDARLLPEKDVHHLIKVRHFERLGEPWEESVGFHYRMPDRVRLLNPGFKRLSYPRKYQSIMRFGHAMAGDVIASLEEEAVRDSYVLGDQQEQLKELVHDEVALCMLKQAGEILPSCKMLNRTVMKVFYNER